MNYRRLVSGGVGLTALALGLTLSGDGTGGLVDKLVSTLGNDYLFLAVVAGGSLLVAAAMFVSGRASNLDQARMPDAERPISVPAPGSNFDKRVEGLRFSLPLVGRGHREAVRSRLRSAAAEAVVQRANCSRDEADRRVALGEWTTDGDAAAFLAEANDVTGETGHLAALISGSTRRRHRVRRTIDAIDELTPTRRVDR